MNWLLYVALSVVCSHAVFMNASLMHPVHETFCEVQWNAEAKQTEVALRLSIEDEQWVIKHHRSAGPEADVEQNSQPPWQQRFLRTQLAFDAVELSNGRSSWPRQDARTRWLGRKEDGAYVWWFFEVVRKDGKPITKVQTRLLFDLDESYQHRVFILSTKKAVVLTRQKPSAALNF